MSNIPFSFYGYNIENPPVLNTAWNEQKRIVDLNKKSYVFITSVYSTPWRERQIFPNADKCTLFYYWSKWADRRVKSSCHWMSESSRWPMGATKSKIFGQQYVQSFEF